MAKRDKVLDKFHSRPIFHPTVRSRGDTLPIIYLKTVSSGAKIKVLIKLQLQNAIRPCHNAQESPTAVTLSTLSTTVAVTSN